MAGDLKPTPERRDRFWLTVAVLGSLLLGLGGWLVVSLNGSRAAGKGSEEEQRAQPVRVIQADYGSIRAWVFAQGTARSIQREYLTFERNGRVTYVKPGPGGRDLRPGDVIAKGEVLARLDARLLQSDLDTATAALAEAEAQALATEAEIRQADTRFDLAQVKFRRTAELARTNATARQELDEAQAEVQDAGAAKNAARFKIEALKASVVAAQAKLDQARVTMEETEIVSPITGVVAYLNVKPGYYFTQNLVKTTSEAEALQTIPAVVIDTSAYEITVDVPAYEAERIAVGQSALLVPGGTSATAPFDADSPWTIIGEVFSVNPAVNPGGRSVRVDIRTTTSVDRLRDGAYVACWIETEAKNDAVIAPFDAFLFEENRPYAFVVNSETGTVEHREVRFGIQGLGRREILSGVVAGEWLVTDGRYRLVNGAPIRVVETEAEASR